jgi:hypothetical protein
VRCFAADLHIHTALSPCGDDDMTPPAIVAAALRLGLAMIAICDHNTAGNVAATQRAAEGAGLAVVPGIEITTAEEIHVLGLFPDAEAALAVGAEVLATLPWASQADPAQAARFGEQKLLGAAGEDLGRETRLLFAASGFDLDGVVGLIHGHQGLAVASHVDRPTMSVLAQLGLFPPDVRFDAVEVSAAGVAAGRAAQFEPLGLPILCGSDGHYLSDLGAGRTMCEMEDATFGELVLALRGAGGRRCRYA